MLVYQHLACSASGSAPEAATAAGTGPGRCSSLVVGLERPSPAAIRVAS